MEQLYEEVAPIIFDPKVMPKRVNQAAGEDLVLTSACNYYDGVTQQEAEAFYSAMKDPKDETPVSYGLNSRLVKENGKIQEKVWKVGGLYGAAIGKIVYWLKKAEGVAENPEQKAVIAKLVEFYETGDLKTFDDYAILWVKDLDSRIDFVNGFTESYGDPLGMKASWELSLIHIYYPEVTTDYMYVDNAAMRMIQEPKFFDVMVTENTFGDILTDEGSCISGSMGLLPSASTGESTPVFEPIHGSWPQAKGLNIANPLAQILSVAMLFEYFDLKEEGALIRKAVDASLDANIRTPEIQVEGGGKYGTKEVGAWIVDYIKH